MLKELQGIIDGDITHAAVRLWSDELSKAETAAVHQRVQGDPKYREELEGLLTALDSIEPLESDRAIEAIASDYPRLLRERRTKRRFVLGMAAGTLLAIGASLAVFSPWRGPDNSHLQKYFTRIGDQQTIKLTDGSVVTLNTGSQLVVDYSEPNRRILLERGEAYFDVADDPERSFTVDLGTCSVTSVGTAFNIRKHPEGCQIAVIEGVVALHELTNGLSPSPPPISADGEAVVISAPTQHRVEAGWVVEFDDSRNELKAFRPESMDRYRDWRSGLLDFYQEPLFQVVQELNRYSRKKILIEDASLMELQVYSVVRIEEIDSTLNSLEQVLPVEVAWYYDRIVITAAAPNLSKDTKERP